jgi:hypothetical protein
MNCGSCVQANIIKTSFADITVDYNHYSLSKTWNLRQFLINTAADSCNKIGILFNNALGSSQSIASNEWMIRKDELETTWKEPVVTECKVLYEHLLEKARKPRQLQTDFFFTACISLCYLMKYQLKNNRSLFSQPAQKSLFCIKQLLKIMKHYDQ